MSWGVERIYALVAGALLEELSGLEAEGLLSGELEGFDSVLLAGVDSFFAASLYLSLR